MILLVIFISPSALVGTGFAIMNPVLQCETTLAEQLLLWKVQSARYL